MSQKNNTINASPATTGQKTIQKEGRYWIIVGLRHGSGKHRLFESDFRALEAAELLWPGREVIYGEGN